MGRFRALMTWFLILASAPLWVAGAAKAADSKSDLEVQRLQLELEKQKLENERVQLEIEKLRMERPVPTLTREERKKEKKEEKKRDGKDANSELLSAEAKRLGALYEGDPAMLVFDFIRGEFWYKGVRSKMLDFKARSKREQWKYTRTLEHRNSSGKPRYQYQYLNISMSRYEGKSTGTFTWKRPSGSEGFVFTLPGDLTDKTPFGEFRNGFESSYYEFDEELEDGKRNRHGLRFKHKRGSWRFSYDVEFWFDDQDRLTEVNWGMLGEH